MPETAWFYPFQFWWVAALWVLLLGSGAAVLRRLRPWRQLSRPELFLLAAAVALAAGLRLYADPFPSDIRSAYEMGLRIGQTHLWAAGYSVLLHALFLALPATFETACAANVVLGTLTVLALYWLVDVLCRDRCAALASAAVLAVLPISVRFSASDCAHVLAALCLILGLACGALWARGGGRLWLVSALGWLVIAANTRVDSLLFLPAAAAVCYAVAKEGRGGGTPWRPWLAVIAAELLALIVPALDLLSLLTSSEGTQKGTHLLRNPWFASPESPALLVALSLLGAGVFIVLPERRRLGLAWLAAMALVSLPAMYSPNPAVDSQYRYFLPLLTMFCLLAGTGLSFLVGKTLRGALAGAALVLLPLLAALPRLGFLHKRWTHQLEFAFVRGALAGVEDDCTIVRRARWRGDSGLEAAPGLSAEAGRRHLWVDTDAFLAFGRPQGCTVFYRSASCSVETASGVSAASECRQMRDRFRLEPLAEALLPALPYINERYSRDPVPVGLYRVREPGGHG